MSQSCVGDPKHLALVNGKILFQDMVTADSASNNVRAIREDGTVHRLAMWGGGSITADPASGTVYLFGKESTIHVYQNPDLNASVAQTTPKRAPSFILGRHLPPADYEPLKDNQGALCYSGDFDGNGSDDGNKDCPTFYHTGSRGNDRLLVDKRTGSLVYVHNREINATSPDYGIYTISNATLPKVAAGPGDTNYIQTVYGKLLGRLALPAEVTAAIPRLSTAQSRKDWLINLIFSKEAVEVFVERQYVEILGRLFDFGGRNFWVNNLSTLENGSFIARQSEQWMVSNFLASPEFTNGRSADSWVRFMYPLLLGRTIEKNFNDPNDDDLGGLEFWKGQVASVGYFNVAMGIGFSEEALTKKMRDYGLSYLCQELSQSEQSRLVSEIFSFGQYRQAKVADIVSSDDAYTRLRAGSCLP